MNVWSLGDNVMIHTSMFWLHLNEKLWILFEGWGLLVSHKALEDWSANQPGETSGMHGDKDEAQEGNRAVRREADI